MPTAHIERCEPDSCSHVFFKTKFSLRSHHCNLS